MQSAPDVSVTVGAPSEDAERFWRRLLYRWFVQYNPLYLLSAALVLAGSCLWSRGLAQEESVAGPLGVALVAELYAACLVGGAALLTRVGLRRPAVMLALLFILYQWDSTLHTETCPYLGPVGVWATAAWLAVFAAKLHALAWALRVRFSGHATAAASLGAAGLAMGPRVLPGLDPGRAGALVAAWVFALAALYRPGGITSEDVLDGWGRTVLRRATLAGWLLSGLLLGMHVLMWWRDHHLPLTATCLALPLVHLTRRARRESRVWTTLLATLFVAAWVEPAAFSVTSLLAAATLALRALAPPVVTMTVPAGAEPDASPYRAGCERAPDASVSVVVAPEVSPGEQVRLLTGALFAAYLGGWTARWSHGAWPAHVLALDAALGLVVVLAVWRTHVRLPLLPLAACYGHLVVESRILPMPASTVAWGETIVALGFALLAGSLAVTFRLRTYTAPGVARER
jgi:hypothetical protein